MDGVSFVMPVHRFFAGGVETETLYLPLASIRQADKETEMVVQSPRDAGRLPHGVLHAEGRSAGADARVASGRLVVSLGRNMYALNDELIHGADERQAPSISHWMPPAPLA
ncbi:hypothetical protein [Burkholderia stabilis]|uniref:hypothetical protein n=1 Tax=Burkholderia stabilis TaxID=95485 RepID=UPI00080B315B|nr:hypothetical protein [Burkholderia stabilis]